MMGCLVVVYGCPGSEQGGDSKMEQGQMPEGHPDVSEMQQTAQETPVGVPVNPEGEPMVGSWTNVNTGSTVSISVENDQLVYHGAWGDSPLTKIDEHNATGNMGGMGLNVSFDDKSDILSVELVGFGEVYQYKRAG